MSQHDFDIIVSDANTGLTMRSEWNSALQALASSSQGSSMPSITYPCQLWADTTNNLLKVRNTANTDWVILGVLETENWGIASLSGTHEFTVSQRLRGAGNLWRFKDTGAGGVEWGIRCDNGNFLEVCENTGAEAIPVWTVRTTIVDTISETVPTADTADNADTLRNYSPSQTSASGVVVLCNDNGKIDADFLKGYEHDKIGITNAYSLNGLSITEPAGEVSLEKTTTFLYGRGISASGFVFTLSYINGETGRDWSDMTNPGDFFSVQNHESGVLYQRITLHCADSNGLKFSTNNLRIR